MANKKLLERAKELKLEPVEDESDEDLQARINAAQNDFDPSEAETTDEALKGPDSSFNCPDCAGSGLRSTGLVCSTCEGSGKV